MIIDFNNLGGGGSGSGSTYVLPVASSSVLGGVKVGSGLTIDSGGTLSSEGGADGPKEVFLNQLGNKQERKALYDELIAYSAQTDYLATNYRFLNYTNTDYYNGYYEMNYAGVRGGQIYFTAIIKNGSSDGVLLRTARLFPDGDWAPVESTKNVSYTLPIASQGTLGGVKVGSGLTIDSGGTISAIGGSGGGPVDYFINDMTQQERAALYEAISGATSGSSSSANLPEVLSNYRFFIKHTEIDGQYWCEAFFSNWEGDENPTLLLMGIHPSKLTYPVTVIRLGASISSDGSCDYHSNELPSVEDAANDITIQITNSSTGAISSSNLGYLSTLARFNRIIFTFEDQNIPANFCAAPLKYFYREMVTPSGGGEELHEYIGCEININGTTYKGDWHFIEWSWGDTVTPTSWTTV